MKIKIITLPLIIASCEAWTWGGVVNGVKDAVINMDLSTLVHQFFGNVLDVPFCRVSWYDLPENKVVTQSFDEEDEDGIVFEKTRTYKRNFYAGKQAAFKFCFNR